MRYHHVCWDIPYLSHELLKQLSHTYHETSPSMPEMKVARKKLVMNQLIGGTPVYASGSKTVLVKLTFLRPCERAVLTSCFV